MSGTDGPASNNVTHADCGIECAIRRTLTGYTVPHGPRNPTLLPVSHFEVGKFPLDLLHPGVWQSLHPARRTAYSPACTEFCADMCGCAFRDAHEDASKSATATAPRLQSKPAYLITVPQGSCFGRATSGYGPVRLAAPIDRASNRQKKRPRFRGAAVGGRTQSDDVESIEIHHLVPRGDKVRNELVLRVVLRVDFCERP
jgi:hypothetical protein